MDTTIITVDVYCIRSDGGHAYRVFVDNDLFTERTWIWPAYDTFIRENIEVHVEPGVHTLEVRACTPENVFYTKNITVNGSLNSGSTFTV